MNTETYKLALEELCIDESSSTKHFDTMDELRKSLPPFGIAKVNKDFGWFYDKKHKMEFKKDDNIVLLPHMYASFKDKNKSDMYLSSSDLKFSELYKPYDNHNLDNKTILIWRSGGIGDILFAQPSIRYLKMKYPTCKVIFACSPAYFSFLTSWKNLIDELYSVPFNADLLIRADYHVPFEGSIERCKEAETINAYKIFSMRMGLDFNESIMRPILKVRSESALKVEDFLQKSGLKEKDFIAVQLRASTPLRTPPIDVWGRILNPLLKDGHKIVITDRPDLEDSLMKMLSFVIPEKLKKNLYSFCKHSEDITDSVALAKYSKLVIAPDSSMVHVGASVGTPVFGIYAPFPGEIRMSTYNKRDWIEPTEDDEKLCPYKGRNCFTHGHTPCLYNINNASPCFYKLNFQTAKLKIDKLLEDTNA